MKRSYSFADAVKTLGAEEDELLEVLDRHVGGALLGDAEFGLSELLGWFAARAEFVRIARELLSRGAAKRGGISRHSRTDRLHAAHAVIVVVAFFEALRDADLQIPFGELGVGARDQQLDPVRIAYLFDAIWPLPSAASPFRELIAQLGHAYGQCAEDLVAYLDELRYWEQMQDRRRDKLIGTIEALPDVAVRKYREVLSQTAHEYPELWFWAQARDDGTTAASLARLESVMARLRVGAVPDFRWEQLARRHHAALDRPVIDPDEVPLGLSIPVVRHVYVDPDFQVVRMTRDARPAVLSWWTQVPVRHDLFVYLTAFLTSPEAVAVPLLVLGDPGSGKSMLTKVLAARLPASDFLTVRVELRSTPTEADLLDQIEHGLRAALQEQMSWMELTRSAGDALPVVVLDGFDELLQATGVSQTRYLLKVQQFQRERAEAGSPVVVVVTSRISVSSAVQIPDGTHVLRLTPFSVSQVEEWLEVWNAANSYYFTENQLAPLPGDVALRYRDLVQQPLLLLMLALYDAGENALQQNVGWLGEADLYERLLVRFAHREVDKLDRDRVPEDREEDAEKELDQLSVVAFAMFNRGAQWVGETDLNADMAALLGMAGRTRQPGTRTPLSAGEGVLGRFFFVQRAEAVRDSHKLRTYEFLHATFGEYLVARFTWGILEDLMTVDAARPRRQAAVPLDDSELYAVLSFAPLTTRKPILSFLRQKAEKSPDRAEITALVKRLHEDSDHPCDRSLTDYAPVSRPTHARRSVYNLNLVLLYGVLAGRFEVAALGIADWSRVTAFWKSQLSPGEWQTLITSVQVSWAEGPSVDLFADRSGPEAPDWQALLGAKLYPHSFPLPAAAVELDFTADPVANTFRYPIGNQTLEFSLRELKAIHDLLMLAVNEDWSEDLLIHWAKEEPSVTLMLLPALPGIGADLLIRLARVLESEDRFWRLVFARVGTGDDDDRLLDLIGRCWKAHWANQPEMWVSLLEAWLRLRERGFEFPAESTYPHLIDILDDISEDQIRTERPDLAKRIEQALGDFGLEAEDLEAEDLAFADLDPQYDGEAPW